MRVLSLLQERSALADAEAVLLIDDDEIQAREVHVLAEQGVGSEQDLDVAPSQLLEQVAPLATHERSGQEPGLKAGLRRK